MDKKLQAVNSEVEIWRDVVGFEGFYKVSNLGNVKSLDRIVVPTNRDNYLREGKRLTKTIDSFGYERVGFTLNSKTVNKKVHRLVSETFIDNPYNYPHINHIDGNKANNHYSNLEWCTSSQNSIHAFKTGLRVAPIYNREEENNNNSKLSAQQVKEIRSKYISYKYSAKKLALEYNVSESCITHILNNTSWKENVQ
jgi:hypothetical protein